jgi:integrase
MASIHKDPRSPKGSWYAAFYRADGTRAFRSTKTTERRQALAIAHAWEAAEREARAGGLTKERVAALLNETLTRCGHQPLERISVRDWLGGWLQAKRGTAKESSIKAYAQAVNLFLEFLGPEGSKRRLESITERDIELFTQELVESGRSTVTVNKLVRKYLSAPFEKARLTGKIRYNPVRVTAPLQTLDKPSKGTFTLEQVAALLKVADNDWQGAILFAYTTGARLSDTVNLRYSSLDRENGIIVFTEQKTGIQAVNGLHPDFKAWLESQPVVPFNREASVFPTLAGRPLDGAHGLSNVFIGLIDAAGIPNRLMRKGNNGAGHSVRALSFHSFRHTAASEVFKQAALKEITRRVTNHAAGGVVDRYIHQDVEAIQEATALIPRLPK